MTQASGTLAGFLIRDGACRIASSTDELADEQHPPKENAMDGMTRTDLQAVVAPLNFMEPMAEKPFSYNYEPPPGQPARNGKQIEHKVNVRDARPVNHAV